MTPDLLATLLDEANQAPDHSVRAALARADGQPHPRIAALAAHLTAVKQDVWAAVSAVTGTTAPPADAGLTRLMTWEVGAVRALPLGSLSLSVNHAGATSTVAELLRALARHTLWHAGQMAALANRPRLA
ncbi:hypothetical protein K7W42_02065 [Deinococcus sp. HMF7604]|uniref:hypothetical protein n=1 Tax=Deinococcus betulae TaxID=2873312 RepID=UPI001CCD00CD|nr:hypothetical protein [Deinococcus betulae]MBZ9749642.1 hypothetical protein [Deinococcus betulae]